jgi:YVTN family beta-propeller protein
MPQCLLLPALLGLLVTAPAPQPYRVLKTIPVGGTGGWDYLSLDADAHRLYVSRSDHVSVVDTETAKVVGEVPKTDGVHGIAIAAELGKGFTSNGHANTVTIFDLKTLAVLGEAKTGDKPDAILYDAGSQRVFAFNGHSADVTVIDAKAGKVAATLALGGAPEFAVADGQGKIFVNLEDKNEVVALDAKALQVLKRWPLTGGDGPTGLAFDPQKRRLFSGCSNEKMLVSDADTGAILAALPIGWGVDATAFDAERRLAFSSNGQGTVTVVAESGSGYAVAQTLPTAVGSKTMALDPRSHRLYLGRAQFGPAPAPTAEHPHPHGAMLPGSFAILVVGQ